MWDGSNEVINTVLPKGLNQLESRVPTEEKDVLAYYYLLKHPGRSLLFVNSIKSARRVDGLLRALGLNCRTIHAQLQQRQRMRALEAFRYINCMLTLLLILLAGLHSCEGLDFVTPLP